ncbi:MAG: hypothetical protein NT169_18635 [Chloroflexi bacterium]|nr:hypothetical protein [Chloroflexota bacterium]
MSRYIIRKIHLAHCKRGPARCKQCREMDAWRICLLDIAPPRPGESQRRLIQVYMGGEAVWREYDVVRMFDSEAEARGFARENRIADVNLIP